MNEKIIFSNDIDITIKFSKTFTSVFDFGYTLVDLNSVMNSFHYIILKKQEYISLPTTARKFTKQFSKTLQLKNFEKGSLLLDVGTSLLSTIISKYLERHFGSHEVSKVQRNINFYGPITVIINSPDKKN